MNIPSTILLNKQNDSSNARYDNHSHTPRSIDGVSPLLLKVVFGALCLYTRPRFAVDDFQPKINR